MLKNLILLLTLLKGFNSFAGIYEPNVLWQKSDIKVCFYDEPSQLSETFILNEEIALTQHKMEVMEFDQARKNKIRRVIEANYTSEATGIYFHGWKKCSEDLNADMKVIWGRGKSLKLIEPLRLPTSLSI